MKFSRYLLVEKNHSGNVIVFSTITRAVVLLTSLNYENLLDGKTDTLSTEEIEELLKKHILINDGAVEENYVDFSLTLDRLSNQTFASYLAISTLCNFSCVYCYEKGQTKSKNTMSKEEIDNLILWYEKILISGRYKTCHIELYGGEPLLFFSDFKFFIDSMMVMCKKNSIKLEFSMTSNGYLLTSEKVNYLLKAGLKEVQITLDGLQPVHDSRRFLKTGEGTFETIISNIKDNLHSGLQFTIRIHFGKDNISDVKDLIKYLNDKNLKDNILLYFAPIHQTMEQINSQCSFCSKHIVSDYDEIADLLIDLYATAKEFGYKIPYYYTNGPCMVLSKDNCLIAPDGGIYKCVEMIDNNELCVGNVSENNYNDKYYDFVSAPILKKCFAEKCIFALMCGGGCMMQSYILYGNCENPICCKRAIENINRGLLQLNYGTL